MHLRIGGLFGNERSTHQKAQCNAKFQERKRREGIPLRHGRLGSDGVFDGKRTMRRRLWGRRVVKEEELLNLPPGRCPPGVIEVKTGDPERRLQTWGFSSGFSQRDGRGHHGEENAKRKLHSDLLSEGENVAGQNRGWGSHCKQRSGTPQTKNPRRKQSTIRKQTATRSPG